jgi:hypothetical protein
MTAVPRVDNLPASAIVRYRTTDYRTKMRFPLRSQSAEFFTSQGLGGMVSSGASIVLCAVIGGSLMLLESREASSAAVAKANRVRMEIGAGPSQRVSYNIRSSGLCKVSAADSEAIVDRRIARSVSGFLDEEYRIYHLRVVSSFRSYESQAKIYEQRLKEVRKGKTFLDPASLPGHSFHEAGLAIDLGPRQVLENNHVQSMEQSTKYGGKARTPLPDWRLGRKEEV